MTSSGAAVNRPWSGTPGFPGGEHGGGGGEPGGVRGAVEADLVAHVLRGEDAAAGLEPFPAEQITQRAGGGAVAAFGEHAAALQVGDDVDDEAVEAAPGPFGGDEDGDQVVGGRGRAGGSAQRADRLGEVVVRADRVHHLIILEHMFEI